MAQICHKNNAARDGPLYMSAHGTFFILAVVNAAKAQSIRPVLSFTGFGDHQFQGRE
jgi:hypothetical protein